MSVCLCSNTEVTIFYEIRNLSSCKHSEYIPDCCVSLEEALGPRLCCSTVVPWPFLFLRSLSSLIPNCLNLPFGTQGRSGWSLFPTNKKQGTWKVFCLGRALEGPAAFLQETVHYQGPPRAATESLVPCVLPRACHRGTLTRSCVPKTADKRCWLLLLVQNRSS